MGKQDRWLRLLVPPSTPPQRGGWRDWWTILHPPYTAWHLSYVVIGASLAPRVHVGRLVATVLAFFLAVGVAAHCLDELHGRPLRTLIPSSALVTATAVTLAGAVAIGVAGVVTVGAVLFPSSSSGPCSSWPTTPSSSGASCTPTPVSRRRGVRSRCSPRTWPRPGHCALAPALAAVGAFALSWAQRSLSTPARELRRSVRTVEGTLTLADGTVRHLDDRFLLAPLERALRAMSWGLVTVAAGLALARLT